jgi:hypothetical protein
MRQKVATDTFVSRNKTALQGRTPYEKSEASFGATMVAIAKSTKQYIFKHMLPSCIDEDDLDSGMQYNDLLATMRKLVLHRADCMEKITASVNRNHTIVGRHSTFVLLILYV